jgi:hypothetical protein
MTRLRARTFVVLVMGGWASSSCAANGFKDVSVVESVRILASTADPPYAAPGSTVKVRVLAYDGRPTKAEPMRTYWLPFVCKDPPNDAYYQCFRQFSGQGAANAGTGAALVTACSGVAAGPGGAGAKLQPGVDLTPLLPATDCVEFTMPADAVAAHASVPAPPVPFGLAILFNIACAGHLELVPLDPGNVQAPPIGCFDAQHNRLGATDFVFGFTRVYAYDTLQNANPVIDHVDVEGQAVDPTLGFQTPHCSPGGSCTAIHIGPVVPASSQEPNPQQQSAKGNPVREEVWAEFFSTIGTFRNDARLLYDATTGSVGGPNETDNEYQAPDHPGEGTIWIIVHDNRGGSAWKVVPVHVT